MTIAADTAINIDPYQFRGVMRRQAASVAVVTAPGPVGFTVTSFTSVSLHPQLVSFALDTGSSSWPGLQSASHVAVHLLRSGQQDTARTFATSGIDRFAWHQAWRPGPYGLPILLDPLALLICSVVERIPAGDHAIVLGSPVSAQFDDGEPLVYHMGGYR